MKSSNFSKRSIARSGSPVKKKKPKRIPRRISGPIMEPWVAVGIDLSTTSIAGCAFGWNKTLRKEVGPVFKITRWEREHDYFVRMGALAKGGDFLLDLIGELHLRFEADDVHIAIEEPWPFGYQKRGESNSLKQQAQMSGCFIGALLRWEYTHIHEIHNMWWKKIIADDLGITTHWTKYGKGVEGKMRSKEWALKFPYIPDWPDLIQNSKRGLIPRSETSKAKAAQPDDRYDALAIAKWMRNEIMREQEGEK
jgi:hypothetical protein